MEEIFYYFKDNVKNLKTINGSAYAIFLPTDWEIKLTKEYIQVKKQEFPEFYLQKIDDYTFTLVTKSISTLDSIKNTISDDRYPGVRIEIKFKIDEDEIFFLGTSSFLIRLKDNFELKDIKDYHNCKNIENLENELFVLQYESEDQSANDYNAIFNLIEDNVTAIDYVEPNFITYQKVDFDASELDIDESEAKELIESSNFLNEDAHKIISTPIEEIYQINTPKVTIGILDTIIDLDHDAIKNNSFTGGITQENFSPSKNPTVLKKKTPHGMQCIGLATASTTNALLNKHLINLGSECSIASGIIREHEPGIANEVFSEPANIIKAINHLVYKKNVKVIIITWNWDKRSTYYWGKKAITKCITHHINNNNISFVVSAGNNSKSVQFPATIKEVISVGAIDLDGKYISKEHPDYNWWSNEGNRIDIAAPGVNLITTDFTGTSGVNYSYNGVQSNDYCFFKGTSAAAPIVGGAIGLILSLADKKNITLTPREIKNILLDSASTPLNWKTDTWGEGILNISAALSKI